MMDNTTPPPNLRVFGATQAVSETSPLSLRRVPAGRSCVVTAARQAVPLVELPPNYDGCIVSIYGVSGQQFVLLGQQVLGPDLPTPDTQKSVVLIRYTGGGWFDGFFAEIRKSAGMGVTPRTLWQISSDTLPMHLDGPPHTRLASGGSIVGATPVRILAGDPSRRRVQLQQAVAGSDAGAAVAVGSSAADLMSGFGLVLPTNAGGTGATFQSAWLELKTSAEIYALAFGGTAGVTWVSEHVD